MRGYVHMVVRIPLQLEARCFTSALTSNRLDDGSRKQAGRRHVIGRVERRTQHVALQSDMLDW